MVVRLQAILVTLTFCASSRIAITGQRCAMTFTGIAGIVRCAARSAHRLRAEPELLSEFPPNAPWVCVNMDILKIGQMTQNGNLYVLSIIDKLTRFCILQAMLNQEAETVLRKFTESMLIMGFPRHIFTDCGTQFTSRLVVDLAQTFGMVCVCTSKFNPRSNGQAENMNKIVLAMLAKICKTPNADDWDEMLPYVQVAHNSTPHSVTGYKPFTLLFGHDFMSQVLLF